MKERTLTVLPSQCKSCSNVINPNNERGQSDLLEDKYRCHCVY